MYRDARILVTGGAGFLGSQLIRHLLLEQPKEVVVLDDLFTGLERSLPITDKVTFVHGSITDGTLVRRVVKDADYVFHFAARNMSLSVDYPESDFIVNTYGTVQLLLNALADSSRLQRLIYASTSSIYGDTKQLPIAENQYHVSTPYAASKFSAELLTLAYGESFGLPVTAVRFSNVYGPGQVSSNPYCGVVSKFMQALVDRVPLTIYDDGNQSRDFTYVDDAIQAALLAGLSKQTTGTVMNIGTGVETTVNDLAKTILTVAGKQDFPIEYRPKRVIDTVRRRVMDISKIKGLTGWTPSVYLEAGVRETWNWFVQPQDTVTGGFK